MSTLESAEATVLDHAKCRIKTIGHLGLKFGIHVRLTSDLHEVVMVQDDWSRDEDSSLSAIHVASSLKGNSSILFAIARSIWWYRERRQSSRRTSISTPYRYRDSLRSR